MEGPPPEGDAEVSEPWLSKWERQCLAEAEAEQGETLPPEQQAEATAEAEGIRGELQRVWHLFQLAANAVAQLYQDSECQQPEQSVWDPFQRAAMAVTDLYKESGDDARRRCLDLGVQVGCRRRVGDVLEWAKKGRSTIRREDLISFLCGKAPPEAPPPRAPRTPPKPPAGAAGQAAVTESNPSVDVDLQLFHEAAALHGLDGAAASVGVPTGAPGSPPQGSGVACGGRTQSSFLEDDLNRFGSEELGLHLDSGGIRKRPSTQLGDCFTDSPSHKRNRMV
ncbi:HUWE1-associated protein modifying stress responses 2 [Cavia porcellus]|uniref:HUWE1-associated protein modifying stress responses 2 n=1 Tax=Cavia porcellus TaxID=10141 RepID=UPI000184CC3E|nr:UPF0472 protein C16orf72 homolog [Cavia porcellus]